MLYIYDTGSLTLDNSYFLINMENTKLCSDNIEYYSLRLHFYPASPLPKIKEKKSSTKIKKVATYCFQFTIIKIIDLNIYIV